MECESGSSASRHSVPYGTNYYITYTYKPLQMKCTVKHVALEHPTTRASLRARGPGNCGPLAIIVAALPSWAGPAWHGMAGKQQLMCICMVTPIRNNARLSGSSPCQKSVLHTGNVSRRLINCTASRVPICLNHLSCRADQYVRHIHNRRSGRSASLKFRILPIPSSELANQYYSACTHASDGSGILTGTQPVHDEHEPPSISSEP